MQQALASGFGTLRAAPGFERAPGAERVVKPRRDLRVLRVEREHGVGDEIVAGAVGAVELGLVGLRKGADQRATRLGLAIEKAGWPVSARTRSSVAGSGMPPAAPAICR